MVHACIGITGTGRQTMARGRRAAPTVGTEFVGPLLPSRAWSPALMQANFPFPILSWSVPLPE
jgi:hypothetical protein